MTKSEAFDILAAAIEYRQDDIMDSDHAALTRIRGTYWGIMARGIDPGPTPEQKRQKLNRLRAEKAKKEWRRKR